MASASAERRRGPRPRRSTSTFVAPVSGADSRRTASGPDLEKRDPVVATRAVGGRAQLRVGRRPGHSPPITYSNSARSTSTCGLAVSGADLVQPHPAGSGLARPTAVKRP